MPRFTTSAVRGELQEGVGRYGELQQILNAAWLGTVPEDRATLARFGTYARQLGDGEASVLAYCAVHGGTAVLDDQPGYKMAQREEIPAVRSLTLLARARREDKMEDLAVEAVVGLLIDANAYFPVGPAEVIDWMDAEGID